MSRPERVRACRRYCRSPLVTSEGRVSALVAFAAPHRTMRRRLDAATPSLRFGRHGQCEIRIGHSPLLDEGIPRLAGQLLLWNGRVAVENLDDVYAFDVGLKDGPRSVVRPGDLHSPGEPAFEVQVVGAIGTHTIRVLVIDEDAGVPTNPAGADSESVTSPPPRLTAAERAVLEAYLAPLKDGKPLHATHTAAAGALGMSKTWVRARAADIYDKFFIAGVPMRDYADDVDAVVDAAWRHHV